MGSTSGPSGSGGAAGAAPTVPEGGQGAPSTGPAPRSVDALAAGFVLDGRYRLVERIGRGGFGDVWRAVELLHDQTPLRDVALKLLAPEIDDGSWTEEAKLLASFSHPSLVTIYAAGLLREPGLPFVAMELLRGESLGDLLARRARVPWRAALRWMRDVAAALDVIHARGVVHLDLKPANLFLTEGGRVKVLDFGISQRAGGRAPARAPTSWSDATVAAAFTPSSSDPFGATQRATTTQRDASASGRVVVGTPGYVAPEVLSLEEPRAASDAYALGATLVVLTTGDLPQALSRGLSVGATPDEARTWWLELRESTLAGRLRDLSKEGLPPGVVRLAERLLDVDPERRLPGGASLAALVEETWARPHGVPARPYPGARAYGPEHEGFLEGRDEEATRLVRDLTYEPALVLSGPVGAGKTSLLRAVVAPELAKQGLDGCADVRVAWVDLAAEDDADAALATALARVGVELDADDPPPPSGRGSRLPTSGDLDAIEQDATSRGEGLVLLLDGLERLVAAPGSRVARLLAASLRRAPTRGVRVVGTIVPEAVAPLDEALGAVVAPATRQLGPPAEALAAEIALRPAERAGHTVSRPAALVEPVAAELARGGVPLPPIALALAAWFDRARERAGALDGGALAAEGGVARVVHRAADAALSAIDGDLARRALDVLVRLTTTDGRPTERTLASLALELEPADGVRAAVEELVARFLLRDRGGVLSLAHPALAEWPRLVAARLAAMDTLALRERLEEAASGWERAGRREDYLDPGDLVRAVEREGLRALTPGEVEFVAESARRLRRRRWARAAVALAVVASLVGVVVGKRALDRRRAEAEQNERAAEQRARLAQLVARARQATDPYERIALFVSAMQRGAADPALPLELVGVARDVAPARFLSLGAVEDADMPWDERWVVGVGASGSLVVIDLQPPRVEAEPIEHLDVDVDPKKASIVFRTPRAHTLALRSALAEVVPLAWDTGLVTRDEAGGVDLFRLREEGDVAHAAVAPFACRGRVAVAERALVIACPTERGVAVWDAGRGVLRELDLPVAAVTLSPDGQWLAGWSGGSLATWRPFSDEAPRVTRRPRDVVAVAFAPREEVLAVATEGSLEVMAAARPADPVITREGLVEPEALRWDAGGWDVALCGVDGRGAFHFLGGAERPAGAAAPSGGCTARHDGAPRLLRSRRELGRLGQKEMGHHLGRGGFLLRGDQVVTRTLLATQADDDVLVRRLRFDVRDVRGERVPASEHDAFLRVVRAGSVVALERPPPEGGGEGTVTAVHLHEVETGRLVAERPGRLLSACPDGGMLGWRHAGDGGLEVFDVGSDATRGRVAWEPGFVVGVDAACSALVAQTLDGRLVAHPLAGGAPRVLGTAEAYVFDAEPSAAFDAGGAGILVAFSNGAVARLDVERGEMRVLAWGRPRVTAIAEGPAPGEALFADGLGVHRVGRDGAVELLAESGGRAPWQDLAVARAGRAVLVASAEGLGVIDVEARALVTTASFPGLSRLTPWGEAGSILAYAADRVGTRETIVIPFGDAERDVLGAVASNLRVAESGAIELRR